jgi:two-component system chemotaxis response regulator CheY
LLEMGLRPEIILVDWHMPNMTGVELIEEIRRHPDLSAITVVMVTSESGPEQIDIALSAGADEYLMKPFTHDAVASKLELLEIRRQGTLDDDMRRSAQQ